MRFCDIIVNNMKQNSQNLVFVSFISAFSMHVAYSVIYIYVTSGGGLQSPENMYLGGPMHYMSVWPLFIPTGLLYSSWLGSRVNL